MTCRVQRLPSSRTPTSTFRTTSCPQCKKVGASSVGPKVETILSTSALPSHGGVAARLSSMTTATRSRSPTVASSSSVPWTTRHSWQASPWSTYLWTRQNTTRSRRSTEPSQSFVAMRWPTATRCCSSGSPSPPTCQISPRASSTGSSAMLTRWMPTASTTSPAWPVPSTRNCSRWSPSSDAPTLHSFASVASRNASTACRQVSGRCARGRRSSSMPPPWSTSRS